MADPVDFSALQDLYNTVQTQSGVCDHASSTIMLADGVYTFHCSDCGRHGIGDEKAARYLGWIE